MLFRSAACTLTLFALTGFNPQTLAATYVWTGSTDANWADQNWLLGGTLTAAVPGTGDTAIFSGAGNLNTAVSLGGGVTVLNVLFDTSGVAAYTIGTGGINSQTLTLNDAGSINLKFPVSQNQTIDSSLVLGTDASAQTYTLRDNSPTATLDFAGNISGGTGGTAGVETINFLGGGSTLVSGVISNGGATNVALTQAGTGTTTLTAANTYTGVTAVNAGTLKLDFTASGAPSNNIINGGALSLGGGTLLINGNATTANTQTFSGTTLASGQSVLSIVSNGTTPTLNLGGITVSGAQGGSGATLEIPTTGTVTTTTLGGGALGLLGSGAGANSTGGYATYGLSDWATTDTIAGAAGTSPATIRGLASVTGGYVNGQGGTGQGTNLDLTANINLGGNSGNSTIRFNTPAATTLNVNGKWFIVSGVLVTPNMGAVNAQISGGNWFGNYSATNTQNIYLWQNNTQGFFINSGGMINGRGGGGSALQYIQSGVGTVVQAGSVNAYTGQTYLNGGYDVIGNDQGLGAVATGATLNLNGGTLVGNATFSLDNGGANVRAVTVGSAGGGIAASAGNTLTVDGVISGAVGGGPLTIGIPASSANGNTAGLLPGTGASTANVTGTYGTGTVVLNNATGNSFYGGVNIVGGATLNINSEYALGGLNYGGITFNNGTLQYATTLLNATTDITQNTAATPVPQNVTFQGNATIDVNGHNVSFANTVGNGGSGSLTVASSGGNGSLTFNSSSTFTGAVTVNSGATLALGGANGWTGNTTLNGRLTLNSGASLANTAITVNSGGVLQAKTGNNGIGTGASASVTLNGGSTLSLQDGTIGTLALNGGLTINGASAASLDFDLSGTGNDVLAIAGAVGGTGIGKIFLNNLGGTAPSNGQQFTLINAASGLGTSLFTLGTTSLIFGSQAYNLTLTNSTGTSEIVTLNFASLNYYWTGGTSTWGTLGNFATDHTGANAQTSALGVSSNVFLTADTSGNYSQTLDGSYKINSLSFTGTNTGTTTGAATNSVTLASGGSGTNTLTLNGANTFTDAASNSYSNTGLVDQAGSAAHTISANINLGNSQSWEIDSANALVVSGTIADGSTADALTKTGNGTLILSASNTYDGGTTVSAGTLKIATSNALLGTSALTVNGTGTFDLSGYNQSISSLSDGGVATGSIIASTGTSNLMINGNASSSFGGSIGGAINITQNGSGTLTLSGSNSYTGLTTLNAGSLIAASNAALGNSASATGGLLLNPASGTMTASFTSANPTIASLANSGAGASNIVLGNGPGNTPTNLTITGAGAGAGTTFSGVISDLSASHAAATGSITLLGGSLTLTGTNTFAGNTTVNGGALNIGNALALQNSTLNLVSGSAVIGATPTTLTLGGLTGSQNFALTNTAATPAAVALSIGGVAVSTTYTGNLSGLGGVTKNGSGTIQFGNGSAGGASYAGPTAITNGTLILGGTGTITGGVTLSGAGGVNALTVQDTAAINSGSTLYIQTGNGNANPFNCTVLLKNSASVTVAGLSFGEATRVTSDSLTIQDSAKLIDNGFFDFDYNLGGTTNGTPTTQLNGGTLAVQKFQMTATPSGITNPSIHFNGGVLEALANDTSTSAYFFPAITDLVADVDGGGAIVNTNGFNVTIAQALIHGTGSPDGGLTKTGAGTLTLAGNNTYSGVTTIKGGDIVAGSANAFSTGNIVFGGGTLQYTSTSLIDWSPRFIGSTAGPISIDTNGQNVTFATGLAASNTGGLTVLDTLGTGSLTLSAPAAYTGPTTIGAGAKLNLTSASSLANTAVTNNGTLTIAGNNSIGSGSANLTLNSGSTLSLVDGAIGSLTLNGGMTIGGPTTAAGLDFELNGTTSDTINVSGALTFGTGGGVIYLTALTGSTAPAPNQTYTLFTDANGITNPNFTLSSNQFFIGGQNFTASLSTTGTTEVLSLTPLSGNLNYYYRGANTPNTWSALANFTTDHTGATAQTAPLTSQANVFVAADNATGYTTETLDGTYTINSLSFTGTNSAVGNTPAATSSVNLAAGTGGPLTIAATSGLSDANSVAYPSGTGIVVQNGSAAHTISANINLGNSQTWEIDNSASAPLTVSGVIADGSTHDALTKTGAGKLILSNSANTYDGGTTVSGGTLELGASGALPSVGTLTVSGSGTFDVGGNNATVPALSDGGVATGTITNSAATAATLTITNSAPNTFSGTITDNSANVAASTLGITINGGATVTLSGSNSYSGLTTVAGSTLIAASNNALGNSTAPTGGLLLQSGTAEFTSANPAIATLNPDGSAGTGTSIILGNVSGAGSATTLTIGGGGVAIPEMQYAGVISDLSGTKATAIGNLNITGGSFVVLNGANTFTGITTISGAGTLLQVSNALALQDSTLNYNNQGGAIQFGVGGTISLGGLTGSQDLAISTASNAAFTLAIGGTNLSTIYTGNLGGLGGVIKNGTGTIQFGSGTAGGASYAGSTTVASGTLILGGTGTVTGAVSLTGAGSVNTLTVQDTAAINSSSVFYIQTGAGNANPFNCNVLLKNSASVTVAGLSFGQGSRVTSDSLTIQDTATLTDNGFFDFDNNLGGSTNGTPSTHLNGGVLSVQKFQMTAGSSGITNPSFHFNGGTLDALANDTSSTAFFLPAIGGLTADVDSGGAFINSNGFNITIAQALVHGTGTPDGGLAVSGGGSLTLTGTNTYTGPTTINTGATLQLGNGATGNDGTIATSSGITDNGTLIYNRFGSPSSAVAITGAGVVQKIGPGAQTLSATSGYTGATTVSGGTLIVSGALSATASLSVSNGATLELAANNALNAAAPLTLAAGTLQTLANQVQSLGNLTIGTGASTLTLGLTGSILNFADSSTNTWTGTLAITNWNGSRAGSGSDQIFIGSSADLTLAQLADITFTNGTVNGISFASSPATQLADGEIVAAIPEPGTWAMLLTGIGALAVWQRRRGMRIG